MSITSPDDRLSEYNPVVATTDFPAVFPVFDNDDIAVFVDGVERVDFSVSATYVEGISTNAKAIFSPGITGFVQVVGSREPRRKNRFQNGAPLPIWAQNLALDTLESEMQESRRDIERAVKSPIGEDGLDLASDLADGDVLMKAGNRLVKGPQVGSIPFATFTKVEENDPGTVMSPYLTTHAFKYRGFVSPLDFGVPGVGNDITAPFLAACAAEDIFAVTLPPGIWHIEDQGLIEDRPFALGGFGPEISQLHQHTSGKSAIRFISTHPFSRWNDFYYRTIALKIRDLAVVTTTNNSANGIHAEWVDFVDETPFFTAHNVKVMSDEFTHSFENGIYLKNANATVLDNVHVVGDSNSRSSASAAPYAFKTAVFWDGGNVHPKVAHNIRGFHCRDMNTAFKVRGWHEGFHFSDVEPALVGRCFDVDGYSVAEGGVGNPNFHIVNSHMNFREHGIVLKDIYNVFIDNVDFLKDGGTPGNIDGSCVLLDNVPIVSITNNRFGRASQHTGVVRGAQANNNINGYRIQGNYFDGMNTESVLLNGTGGTPNISNNTFVGAGSPQVGVRVAAGIGGGAVSNNVYQGTWALRIDAQNPSVAVEGNTPQDAAFTFASLDTTPSVGGKNTDRFNFTNLSATSVTTFDDGREGQKFSVIAQNGNTTLVHSGTLILQGGVNWNMPAGSTSEFYRDGTVWRQKSRLIV